MTPRMCARCVLSEHAPDIVLDAEGVCNVCRLQEKAAPSNAAAPLLETDFVKIVNQHKGKHAYDCMVMCSGGKDSTASLYYMKRRYGLKVLAFMFDHGFETEDALENVRNAVDRLGVDFLFFRSDYMKGMFARMIKSGSKAVLCHPCSIWYMRLAFDVAEKYDIPIIIAGWTKGQSTRQEVMTRCACSIDAPEFASMATATREFLASLADDPHYKDFPRSMEEVLAQAKKRHKAIVLSPHWFLNVHPDEYVELIKKELGWKYPRLSYPAKSTNCYLNYISAYLSIKHYGYTHYHVEASKLIRAGLLSRQEALENLAFTSDKEFLNKIAEKLGCGID